jgi:DNA-binding NarL/FixJ family response regulator
VTLAQGRTNAEIADELPISLSTVKFHLASLMNKIGARVVTLGAMSASPSAAARMAWRRRSGPGWRVHAGHL